MADEYDLTVIQRHPVYATYGADKIGPSETPLNISFDAKTYESMIQENGGAVPVAKLINSKTAKIEIETKNVAYILGVVDGFAVGDDVYAVANSGALVVAPIGGGASAKIITFTNAFVEPETSYIPKAGEDHTGKLVITAFPDATTGKLFTLTDPA